MSYKKNLPGSWWLKHHYFKAYMVREATVVPLAIFICSLLAGIFSVQDAERFQHWQAYMAHPLIIFFHTLALTASLYHAATFFRLFPRVMPIRLGGFAVPARYLVWGQWIAVFIVLGLMLLVFVRGGGV